MIELEIFKGVGFRPVPVELVADVSMGAIASLFVLLIYRVLKLNREMYTNGDSLLAYLQRSVGDENINYFFIGAAMAKSRHENLSSHECRMVVVSWLKREQGMSAKDLSQFYVKAKADLSSSSNMDAVKKGSRAYRAWLALQNQA